MFVEAHVTLPLDVEHARIAVEDVLEGQALLRRSQQPVDNGLDLEFIVGPRTGLLSKVVHAQILETRRVDRTYVIPLRWEATGPASRLYPALDANIGITPIDQLTCVLSIVGSYTPPLGSVGSSLDRAAMSRLATSTLEDFLTRLAREATTAQVAHT
jgi:hypothetical protein